MNDTRTQSCATCEHHNGTGDQFECRAHPPTMIPVTQQGIAGPRVGLMPAIPIVAPTYWCGEWRDGVDPTRAGPWLSVVAR